MPDFVGPEVLPAASRSAAPADGYGRDSRPTRAACEVWGSVSKAASAGTDFSLPTSRSSRHALHFCTASAGDASTSSSLSSAGGWATAAAGATAAQHAAAMIQPSQQCHGMSWSGFLMD